MRDMQPPPLLIAKHPSRSAFDFRQYGNDDPAQLSGWNDTAPNVAVSMAGAPGHQATRLQAYFRTAQPVQSVAPEVATATTRPTVDLIR
jgi:hypothetical protein